MQDMTRGSISLNLIRYAVPMILGNIIQLTYNGADSIVIGKFLGENALAAVSVSNPIMTIMVLGASGIGIGASVIMSRFFGEGDYKKLKEEFSTTIIFSTLFSFLVFAVGFMISGHILRLINAPEEAYSSALVYLRIIFVGFLFTFQYNILSASLRAIGDSKTPVLFLSVSCVLNICLDLVFIAVFNMGVAGAGLATVFAEGVSAVLCYIWIIKKVPVLKLKRSEITINIGLLKETLKSGTLTALQQAAQPIGKVLIQSAVNTQGVIAIGAFNGVCRIDDFACIPAQSLGSGIMTCTAQNRGAGNKRRVEQSLYKGLVVALCYFPIICGVSLLFKTPLMKLLSPNDSRLMIEMGVSYICVKAWFFIMPCINNAIQGFFRGMGCMGVVLMATVIQISIRTVCVYLWIPKMGITGEAYACFTGWIVQLIFEASFYIINRKRLMAQAV